MITMIITAAMSGCGFALAYWALGVGMGWSIAIGLAVFFTLQFLVGMFFKKRIEAVIERVKRIMVDGQREIQSKMQRWQMRPPGSIQAAQREIESDMRVFVKDALAATEELDRFRHWIPMIDRQKATAQLQLNWTIKDFKKVDELLPKAIVVDPALASVKMARLQMLDAPVEEIRKVYDKATRRLRYNQNVLPAACWSWILVKRGMVDEAFKALTEALKKSDDATLKANHEHLMNNRVAHFSNSSLGDPWYSLHLEEPRMRQQRQRPIYR